MAVRPIWGHRPDDPDYGQKDERENERANEEFPPGPAKGDGMMAIRAVDGLAAISFGMLKRLAAVGAGYFDVGHVGS